MSELSVMWLPFRYTIYGCTQIHNTCEVAKVILCSLFATGACLCKEQLGAISPFSILSILDGACPRLAPWVFLSMVLIHLPSKFPAGDGPDVGNLEDSISSSHGPGSRDPFQAPCQVAGFHSWFGACEFASQIQKI